MRQQLAATAATGPVPGEIIDPLILDLLEWLAPTPRPYDEVMEVWRTSCPRLTVWESAVDGGFVVRRRSGDEPAVVEVTAVGHQRLRDGGRAAA
jgi:D-3-phosphoglycerate dehydrogenase